MDDHTSGDMEQIEAWLRATGMSESRLGLLACANPRAVSRIRSGSARVETLRLVLAYIEAHPASLKEPHWAHGATTDKEIRAAMLNDTSKAIDETLK
jgi:hypothetical protein